MNSDYHQPDSNTSLNGESLDAAHLAEARLTAYVLGELDDEDRAAVEKELAESETARQQLGEIRRSVELVAAALGAEANTALTAEPAAALSNDDRERLFLSADSRARDNRASSQSVWRIRKTNGTRYFLAASLLVCILVGGGWLAYGVALRNMSLARVDFVGGGRDLDGEPPQWAKSANSLKPLKTGLEGRRPSSNQPVSETGVLPSGERYSSNTTGLAPATPMPGYASQGMMSQMNQPTTAPAGGVPDVRFIDSSMSMGNGLARRSESRESLFNLEAAPKDGLSDLVSPSGESNTEGYNRIYENPFLDVRQNPLSTFSIDVDTASYANVRRFLNSGSLPPVDAVRIEELVNYFSYHYAPPADETPFAVHAEVAGCPWEPKHRLLRIALKGREIDLENRPASNLVFLIDVSGSMDDPAKLPLLKSALHMLVDKLAENDRVAMVVYAGSSGLVLPSTSGLFKETILGALDQLQAGGSTNGGSGIQLAYQTARERFIPGGTNRVILCTDGDFNVGITDQGSLTRLIEEEAKSGVFLSVLGFGTGNVKDSTMEQLADRGNGNYAYIDSHKEARKVLVEQLGGTLVTIAKDVKLQLEFNPRQVAGYRLVGYENRVLRAEDFNDDKKDAGEIGAGHTVTAFYELVPAGVAIPAGKVDDLKYQRLPEPAGAASDEMLTLKLRYKEPEGATSKLIETVVKDTGSNYAQAGEDFRFATAVAGFGLVLRDSQYKGDLTFGAVLELAQASRGTDENGYRAELIELVKKAQALRP